jgi:hypothetical protein
MTPCSMFTGRIYRVPDDAFRCTAQCFQPVQLFCDMLKTVKSNLESELRVTIPQYCKFLFGRPPCSILSGTLFEPLQITSLRFKGDFWTNLTTPFSMP